MSSVLTWVGQPKNSSTMQYQVSCMLILPSTSNCFGGLKGHLIPFYGVDAIASGCFEIAGKVVAHSILHDGPGFVGLARSLVEYLATGSVDEAKGIVSLDDLPDLELKQILKEEVSFTTLYVFFFFVALEK